MSEEIAHLFHLSHNWDGQKSYMMMQDICKVMYKLGLNSQGYFKVYYR